MGRPLSDWFADSGMRHGAKWAGVPLSSEIASEGTSMNDNQRRADTAPYWNSAVEVTGPRRSDHRSASDTRGTSELISAYLRASDDSEAADLITAIQYRGGAEEFRAGLALLTSKDSRERAAGAEILGQLGWQDRTFVSRQKQSSIGFQSAKLNLKGTAEGLTLSNVTP
jgi:hypothetical protein